MSDSIDSSNDNGSEESQPEDVKPPEEEHQQAELNDTLPVDSGAGSPPPVTKNAPHTEIPQQIGPYRILELLGEGGFGVVYRAESRDKVRQQVALKVIKKGMDTKQVLARFDAEKNALSLMKHPNIARVIASGETDQGQPYFVMEYVDGSPITTYCQRERISLAERLQLFQQVCRGVQHAHSKAVVHRDLKPSNIMVTREDGKPVPKIIDFGLAKALGGALTEMTLVTQQRQILGTLEYMSPEQARSSGTDIDTKTDVYALGTILYELLVDSRPFNLQQLGELEMLRVIEQENPQRPSLRLSSLDAESRDVVAQARDIDSRHLSGLLSSELDWIVLKALEKSRDRRYETPLELAQDIERHLVGHEPVLARPPSFGYRSRKFLHRYRGPLISTTLVLIALIVGISWALVERENATSWRALSAIRYGQVAKSNNFSEALEKTFNSIKRTNEMILDFHFDRMANLKPESLADNIRQSLSATAAVAQISNQSKEKQEEIRTALKMLLATTDFVGLARETIGESFFANDYDDLNSFQLEPVLHARLLQRLAETLRRIGLWHLAEKPLRKSLEIIEQDVEGEHCDYDRYEARRRLGSRLLEMGKLEEAENYLRKALECANRVLESEFPLPALGLKSNDLLGGPRKSTRGKVWENDWVSEYFVFDCIEDLANTLLQRGKLEEAELHLQKLLDDFVPQHSSGDSRNISIYKLMSRLRRAQGKAKEAESFRQMALEDERRVILKLVEVAIKVWGEDDARTLNKIAEMGRHLQTEMGKLKEAEPYMRRALEGRRRVLGANHPDTLTSLNNLGSVLCGQDKLDEAKPYLQQALEDQRRILGEDDYGTLLTLVNLGALLGMEDNFEEAEPYLQQALEGFRRVLGEDDPMTLNALAHLVSLFRSKGELDKALLHSQELVRLTPEDDRRYADRKAWSEEIEAQIANKESAADKK